MEKKQVKAKKAATPKKKSVSKKKAVESPVMAPEATPFVANYEPKVEKSNTSFLNKVKKFLGF
jgi:hypothetical protein